MHDTSLADMVDVPCIGNLEALTVTQISSEANPECTVSPKIGGLAFLCEW